MIGRKRLHLERETFGPRRWGFVTTSREGGVVTGWQRTLIGAWWAALWAGRRSAIVECRCRSHYRRTGTHADGCPVLNHPDYPGATP